MSGEEEFLFHLSGDLVERAELSTNIFRWLNSDDEPPAFLVRGNPGSGKSSVLVQCIAKIAKLRQEDGIRVIASVLHHPEIRQPFDASALAAAVAEGLAEYSQPSSITTAAGPLPNINVSQKAQSAETMTGVVINFGGSYPGSIQAIAEQRVRATPKSVRAVIVLDALDQAEDEGAEEFLRAVDGLVRAAEGTGVRLLCSSRRRIPVWLDPTKRLEFELGGDTEAPNDELERFLHRQLQTIPLAERTRVVGSLVQGAQKNWLWAAINAAEVLDQIERVGGVPPKIEFSVGLTGLYADGWRRIRQRLGVYRWDGARRILGSLACSFVGTLGLTELRWVTGLSSDEIKQIALACEPFVVRVDQEHMRLFHPDFARWLLRAPDAELSEPAEHLRLARGLTELGKAVGWGPVARAYAAPWVVNHWCALMLIDPFRPDAHDDEDELQKVLGDLNWALGASISFETLVQAGLIAPRLTLPGYSYPLLAGVRMLEGSSIARQYAWSQILAKLSDADMDELEAAEDFQSWQRSRLTDYTAMDAEVSWAGLLRGRFRVVKNEVGISIELQSSAVTDLLRHANQVKSERRRRLALPLLHLLAEDEYDKLISELRTLVDSPSEPRILFVAAAGVLGDCYLRRAQHSSEAERGQNLALALAAYTEAWKATPPEDDGRLIYAIDVANTARDLSVNSGPQLELLIEAQREIYEWRRARGDASWPGSANRLGEAYRRRADTRTEQTEQAERKQDLELALAAYTEGWQAAPPDEDEDRLDCAIGVANSLFDLEVSAGPQLEMLIEAQREIYQRRRARDDADWPEAANLLGEAYRQRAETRTEQPEREQDLELALAAYTEAWEAVPPDHEDRLVYAIDVANIFRDLSVDSGPRLETLIEAQREIYERRRAGDDPDWPGSANLLGEAYRQRADTRTEQAEREQDLTLALDAYLEAWRAISPDDDEVRLVATIDVANTLFNLSVRSGPQLELLIEAQREIYERRRARDDADVPEAANLLGEAYRLRAETRTEQAEREQDLALALAAYTEAWNATPPDDDKGRVLYAIGIANTLFDLRVLSGPQVELLIEAQREVYERRRARNDAGWPGSANLLGDAYRQRAESRTEQAEREQDLALALAAYIEAREATSPEDDERRLITTIDVANTLFDLEVLSGPQLEMLIEAQREIYERRRARGDASWPRAVILLGEAYSQRADTRSEPAEREQDLALALAAYTEAWKATPPDDDDGRLVTAIGVAFSLFSLSVDSGPQLELLIEAQREIYERRRARGDASWSGSANLLGEAYRLRAETRTEQAEREQDLALALAAYTEAWKARPPDEDDRLMSAIGVANTVRDLSVDSGPQLELLIEAQREIYERRRARGDASWPGSANLLGEAYRLRAETRTEQAEREQALALALAAYTEAWKATPPDEDEERLIYAIGVANTLFILSARSGPQLEMLIEAQREIYERRRAREDPVWPHAANLLGNAYRQRAETRTEQAEREQDLALALAAYTEAWKATPPGADKRLRYAVDLANAHIMRAAIVRDTAVDGLSIIDNALALVSAEVTDDNHQPLAELRRLLPVLSVRLARRQ